MKGHIDVQACVAQLRLLKQRRLPFMEHVCRNETCHPENEATLTGKPVYRCHSDHIYVCDYGTVHVCGPEHCSLGVQGDFGETVCPISGIVLGEEEVLAVGRNAEPHWKVVRTDKKRKHSKTTTKDTTPRNTGVTSPTKVAEKCRVMIKRLFFSAMRHTRNTEILNDRNECLKSRVEKYVLEKKKARTFLALPEIMCLQSNVLADPLPYAELRESDHVDTIAECVDTVRQIWEKLICRFYGPDQLYTQLLGAPSRPPPEYIILGILYLMKSGHRQQNVVLIPYNAFVAQHLPNEKDLKYFGYSIGRLKPGKDLVLKFYDRAMQLHMYVRIDAYIPVKVEKCNIVVGKTKKAKTYEPKSRNRV